MHLLVHPVCSASQVAAIKMLLRLKLMATHYHCQKAAMYAFTCSAGQSWQSLAIDLLSARQGRLSGQVWCHQNPTGTVVHMSLYPELQYIIQAVLGLILVTLAIIWRETCLSSFECTAQPDDERPLAQQAIQVPQPCREYRLPLGLRKRPRSWVTAKRTTLSREIFRR